MLLRGLAQTTFYGVCDLPKGLVEVPAWFSRCFNAGHFAKSQTPKSRGLRQPDSQFAGR
jgi:hypothetical protein